jgi:glycosyltransferase involved in cell wall biosynthesis
MPSYYESLSMVALEAWALGKPVLANGKCEVLRGQCVRSRAGLYYETEAEFVETLRAISESRGLNAAFSANGREFFQRHYAWPVIEQKYLDILAQVKDEDAGDSAATAWSQSRAGSPGGARIFRQRTTSWPTCHSDRC